MDEFVEDLCARDQRAARTRMALLRLERQAHSHGWDHRDTSMIFELSYNKSTGHVQHRKSPAFHAIVTDIFSSGDMAVGDAFQALAAHVEKVASGGFDDPLGAQLRKMIMSLMKTESSDGWAFYGYAMRWEGWIAPDNDGRDCKASQHPERQRSRGIHFAARDGLFWQVVRLRGEQPFVMVETPESEDGSVGDIPNALSRLTRVFANNPVPIVPAL